jgi:hypothetical protein
MAKIFAASRRKYQALDGFKDRTASVISSGLMIYKKEPCIRIPMLHKNLGLCFFPWLKSEKLTWASSRASFLSGCASSTEPFHV